MAAMLLEMLFRDEYLVAIHKPPGLLVHRTWMDACETRFALQRLRHQIGQPVWPAQRLHKGTSGVLLFSLNANTTRPMGQAFEQGTSIQTTDHPSFDGWPQPVGLIDHALNRLPDGTRFGLKEIQGAQTRFTTLTHGELPLPCGEFPATRFSLVALQTLTGRRHQIRRHLKHISHPILGDTTHGKGPLNRAVAEFIGAQRMLRHAASLAIAHPVTGQPLHIKAEPGPDWAIWSAYLESARAQGR